MSAPSPTSLPDVLLWDIPTAAEATGLNARTVRAILAERRVPVVKIGRLVRVRPDDLRAYIAASTLPAESRA